MLAVVRAGIASGSLCRWRVERWAFAVALAEQEREVGLQPGSGRSGEPARLLIVPGHTDGRGSGVLQRLAGLDMVGSSTPPGGLSVQGNLGETDQSPTSLKSTVPPENSARLKVTSLPENLAPRKLTVPPENPVSLKLTLPPEKSAKAKSTVPRVSSARLKLTSPPENLATAKLTVMAAASFGLLGPCGTRSGTPSPGRTPWTAAGNAPPRPGFAPPRPGRPPPPAAAPAQPADPGAPETNAGSARGTGCPVRPPARHESAGPHPRRPATT